MQSGSDGPSVKRLTCANRFRGLASIASNLSLKRGRRKEGWYSFSSFPFRLDSRSSRAELPTVARKASVSRLKERRHPAALRVR